jgi:N-acetyl-anhydromuramyl-L-alanine amidase AmpD
MNILKTKRLPANQFMGVNPLIPKDGVVLHFTAGRSADGAFGTWLHDADRVGTSIILDLNGDVYEVFDRDAWAFHLGLTGADWERGKHDARTVGIEIVNVGPLKRVGNTLYWWPMNWTTKYCSIGEKARYVEVPTWRGFNYFAAFTDAQLAVIPPLVGTILEQFNIPRAFLPAEKRLSLCLADVKKFKGITNHSNWRADKLDIGPAFPWKIIGG